MPRRKRQCVSCRNFFIAASLESVTECEHCGADRHQPPTNHGFARDQGETPTSAYRETPKQDVLLVAEAGKGPQLHYNSSPKRMADDQETLTSFKHDYDAQIHQEEDNDDDDGDEDGRSEGGDDLHCTQIIKIDDSDDDDDDDDNNHHHHEEKTHPHSPPDEQDDLPLVRLIQEQQPVSSSSVYTEKSHSKQQSKPTFVYNVDSDEEATEDSGKDAPSPDANTATAELDDEDEPLLQFTGNDRNNDLMSCNICGASLAHISTGWKGRLNHIKRCAKKHQYTAKEARFNDDFELFAQNERPENATATTQQHLSTSNPYIATPSAWHGTGDAALAQAQSKASAAASRVPTAFQTLMAGARRAAKIQKIQAQSPTGVKAKQPTAKTGWYSGRPSVDYSQRQCPAFKKIFQTDFVVDGFHYAKSSLTQNYFLTHFHSDHYGGITKAWNAGIIYCSIGTANLVNQQLGVDRKYLHPLPMDTPTVIESRGKPVTVTLIDANHCPGAIMFLFVVGNRTILHVGDFRWNHEVMEQQTALRTFFSGRDRIDDLYLDTTYCEAKYDLPTQQQAIEAAIEVATKEVESARQSKKKLLMLFGAYTIGKERIYLSVAEALGLKVYVDSRRLRILKCLEWRNDELSRLTTKSNETCIWVVPLGHINMKRLEDYLTTKAGMFDRVVGFRPTGWSHSKKGTGIVTSNARGRVAVHNVPYSEHSSFPELVDCLTSLRPKRIVPTVSVSKSQQQVDLLLSHWKR